MPDNRPDAERRAEKRGEPERYVINRKQEEERIAILLAARDARLAALERGEQLPTPEYLPGPANMCKFFLWYMPAFEYFGGDTRDWCVSSLSFCQSFEDSAGPWAEVDPTKPGSGEIYLDTDNSFDVDLFKAPERFMEPFPLTALGYERPPLTLQCTLIDQDHLILRVPIEIFLDGPKPAPDGAPKVFDLFGIKDRTFEERKMAQRLRSMARDHASDPGKIGVCQTKQRGKNAKRNRRKRAAAKPTPAASTPTLNHLGCPVS
ncbi:hypothetical protein PG993_004013 [Apiospora rasikravindrae]|uniref:Uncharacterized protein n=1 Tax=Apiospora rasikravindrae TaxID=990691 RepID=A0ABR1TBJ9_9PEZI